MYFVKIGKNCLFPITLFLKCFIVSHSILSMGNHSKYHHFFIEKKKKKKKNKLKKNKISSMNWKKVAVKQVARKLCVLYKSYTFSVKNRDFWTKNNFFNSFIYFETIKKNPF